MKIFRGVKNILFRNIDPLFRNPNNEFLTYGNGGTSYATEINLAMTYSNTVKNESFGWLLTYDFKANKTYYVNEKNYMDEDDHETQMFIDGDLIKARELSIKLNEKGYDSAYFDYDNFDPHIMLLKNCSTEQLNLEEIRLYTESESLIDKLIFQGYKLSDGFYIIPIKDVQSIDELLS